MAPNKSTKGGFLNISSPGLILVLWDLLFGLPIAYILTLLNTQLFHYLGYEKFMRSPNGTLMNQSLFALINIWLVLGWAWQLMQEAKVKKEENLKVIRQEIRFWDGEIARLEGELEAKHNEERLRRSQRAESEGGEEKKMVIVDGQIRWMKKSGGEKFGTSNEGKMGDLRAWKRGLREPSPFYKA